MIVGFPGESEQEFSETLSLLDEVGYDGIFSFKYSARPNTPALRYIDAIADEEKGRRLQVLNKKQQEIQTVRYNNHLGETVEVLVEGSNAVRGQLIGRTTQNKTLNFTVPANLKAPALGEYALVLVTRTFPNSLAGEMVA
jgi:tRNA-2-methylthio-N6-dimethylallyladenosine synthase